MVRASFAGDPGLVERVFDLLDLVFPGIRAAADRGRELGDAWESVSTPFIHEENGRVVAHVGVIELPMMLMGEIEAVGSVHAVATHPRHRRRGHFRQLMEEMLDHARGRTRTLVLSTSEPGLYRPFGFRVVPEHGFRVRCASPETAGGLRLLDPGDPRDVSLLRGLLADRVPVSRVAGVVRDTAVFCVSEGGRPLYYSEALDAVLVMKLRSGGRLELFDVVARRMPRLDAILEEIPAAVEEVTVAFSPDCLEADAGPEPWVFEDGGPSYLMARGPFAPEGQPFTLPRTGRT